MNEDLRGTIPLIFPYLINRFFWPTKMAPKTGLTDLQYSTLRGNSVPLFVFSCVVLYSGLAPANFQNNKYVSILSTSKFFNIRLYVHSIVFTGFQKLVMAQQFKLSKSLNSLKQNWWKDQLFNQIYITILSGNSSMTS